MSQIVSPRAFDENMIVNSEIILEWNPGKKGVGTLTATLGDDVLAAERCDILIPTQRDDFISRLTKDRPGIDRAALEMKLLRIAGDVASPPEPKPQETKIDDPLAATPEQVKSEALAMLRSPELIREIIDDVAMLGVAGEKTLAATIYLVGTSRLLETPLAAIVQGLTSSGKSHAIKRATRLFPPECVIQAHKMTPQALVHMPHGALVHQFVVGGERSRKQDDETAETTRALREMLSDGHLSKLMPTKKRGTNEIVTEKIDQPGPIAYVESTTLQAILDEDRNRCLILATDESPAQTQRIIRSMAERKAAESAVDVTAIIDKHHAAQRLLKRCRVVIPFAGRLAARFPSTRTDARRTFGHLLSMIEAVTLLHQYQRTDDPADDAVIVATADDYRVALRLLAGPVSQALGSGVSNAARRFGGRLAEYFGSADFDARDAARNEKIIGDLQTIRQYFRALAGAGIIEETVARRGQLPARYKVINSPPDDASIAGLPDVEEIFCGDSAAQVRDGVQPIAAT